MADIGHARDAGCFGCARLAAELAEARAARDAAHDNLTRLADYALCDKPDAEHAHERPSGVVPGHAFGGITALRSRALAAEARTERLEAALRALTNNPHMDLAGAVYEVRERERLGWDGPSVVAWSKAVTDAKAALERP